MEMLPVFVLQRTGGCSGSDGSVALYSHQLSSAVFPVVFGWPCQWRCVACCANRGSACRGPPAHTGCSCCRRQRLAHHHRGSRSQPSPPSLKLRLYRSAAMCPKSEPGRGRIRKAVKVVVGRNQKVFPRPQSERGLRRRELLKFQSARWRLTTWPPPGR